MMVFVVITAVLMTAQQDRETRIQFRPGSTSVAIKGAAVRSTIERYLLGARAGQTMTVRLGSIENNASFSIAGPGGKYLTDPSAAEGAREWRGKLAVSGDYAIEVGTLHGNATYTLRIAIR